MIENYTATVNLEKPFEPVRKCGAIRARLLQLSAGGEREGNAWRWRLDDN